MSLDATYFGSAGVHLRRLMSYNNPEPSQQANSNLARPFPKFGSIQVMSAPGHSSYHALYLKLQRRFSQGLSFLSSFSYGKSIDNGSGIRTSDGDSLTPSNNYDLGSSAGCRRSTSVAAGRRRGCGMCRSARTSAGWTSGGVLDWVLGGWQIGGIVTLQDGFPFTVQCGGGTIQNGGGDLLSRSDGRGLAAAGAASASARATSTPTRSSIGIRPAGRSATAPSRATRSSVPASSASTRRPNKRFPLSGSSYAELRIEVFNLPNHPIWNQPARTLRTPTFGVINSTRMDSRQIQIGLKVVF